MTASREELPPSAREELVAEIRRWRRRRRVAFWVRVVTIFFALALAAPATALLLSQFTSMREDYVPQRHVPGGDGSISITSADAYVLIRHQADLPKCIITAEDGYALLQEPWQFGSHPAGAAFYAEVGRYEVSCEGGQDGVVALNRAQYERSLSGPWRLSNPAWPMFLGTILLFYGGRWAASRIAPESMRPLYPA